MYKMLLSRKKLNVKNVNKKKKEKILMYIVRKIVFKRVQCLLRNLIFIIIVIVFMKKFYFHENLTIILIKPSLSH